MKLNSKIMAAVLVATIVSGFFLHVRGGNGLTALHLICMGTFSVMATLHALSHTNVWRKRFGQPQQTEYVQFDPRKCQACWECVEACKKQVISKVDLPFHRHANIVSPDKCIGCKKCVKVCQHGAMTSVDKK